MIRLAVLDGEPHDLGEDPHRDLGRDRLDPVELVLLERAGEDPAREAADPLLVRVDDPRREALVDEPAHPRVRRRVGVEHRLACLELLGRQVLERRPSELRRERLPVLRDLDDVVVARERPEALPSRSGCQNTGASRRRSASQSYGTPRSQTSRSARSTSSSERPSSDGPATVTERACRGDVVVARVRGLRPRPAAVKAGREARRLLARLVDRKRLERGRRQHVACADVELRAMTRADHDGPSARPPRASTPRGCTCRRTRPRASEPADTDRSTVGLDPPERALRRVVSSTDVVPCSSATMRLDGSRASRPGAPRRGARRRAPPRCRRSGGA